MLYYTVGHKNVFINIKLFLMKLQKQASLFLYVSVLFACYSLAGCRKNTNIGDAAELSSSSSNANARILSTSGIGGFNLDNAADKAIAFDYEHSGRQDYILLYRPGQKIVWIVKNDGGAFSAVYSSANGIGGYNFDNASDKIIAYDYEHSGKLDYLVCFRPGQKIVWILKNTNGVFSAVYSSGSGIGGFPFSSGADGMMAYDYEHTGKQDYLVTYTPGSKNCWILKNNGGTFTPVFQSASGIGGFNLDNGVDRIFAFDYDHTGRADYLTPYRGGSKIIWILNNNGGAFSPVFQSSNGIGGYNLDMSTDFAMAFDYDHSGRNDYVVCYRPGNRYFWILQNNNGVFTPVVQSSTGIGGYNLDQPVDKIFAYDYDHSGKLDYLVTYRPGSGIVWILRNTNGVFTQVF
jgi:hypothetical protein